MTQHFPADIAAQSGLLDAICETLPAAIIVYDRNDQLVFASRQILNFFPVPSQVLRPGTRLRDYLGAIYDSGLRTSANSGDPARPPMSRDEWIAERIAGHWRERSEHVERYGFDRWIRFVKRRLPNGYGLSIASDVSDTMKREEQWSADLERVQLTEEILDSFPFPVFVKDESFAYVAANKAFCRLRGLKPEQLIGRTVHDVMPDDIASLFDRSDRALMENGQPQVAAEWLVNSQGGEMAILKRKVRIGEPGRRLIVTAMADVTDVANGAMQIVPENSSIARVALPVPNVISPGLSLGETAGDSAIHTESFVPKRFSDLRLLLVSADDAVAEQTEAVLDRLGFDRVRVGDAATLAAFLDAAAEMQVTIDLVLIDTGMADAAVDLARQHRLDALVFEGERPAAELSYELTRHFNSRLSPAGPGQADDDDDFEIDIGPQAAPVSLVEVLVAEDNEINQIVYKQILEGLGYSYRVAGTASEAIRLADELSPEIILMDTTLPDMSGFDAARIIRGREHGHRVPIIGVLAQALEGDHLACLDAGMDGILMKPLSPDMIEDLFDQYRITMPASDDDETRMAG